MDSIVDYGTAALDLSSSPTNEWPQNILFPNDTLIWDSVHKTVWENLIAGQAHIWRVIFDYTGKNNNDVVGVDVSLKNPLSGFVTTNTVVLPEGTTSGTNQQALLITFADGASLPPPLGTGYGYNITFNANKGITTTVTSMSRISLQHYTR